ncbi:MAG: DHH family phosphoesterase, partial [Oscillospiraceae bacterium]|nr:DHH family phosphoesterase [Oscillospiraceae bacterium]
MLDTKSFSMRAGVRTFEAAAYLKKMGADTVKVKELFSGSLQSYQHRSKIVSTAEIYRGCAVSFAKSYDDIGIVAPQAADELLAIKGVASSVVMYKTPVGVSFSARSLGGMNVQVIMEALGGGGHQTMAGAQIPDITPGEAKEKLLAAIDDYYEKAAGHADEQIN